MDSYPYNAEELRALLPWAGRPAPVPTQAAAGGTLDDRVRGMLWGVAVGDSLGNTSEGLSPRERHRRYGEIRDYLPHPREDMRRIGFPSDDTQLTFWTVDSLLRRGHLDPADLAETFVGPRIFGAGGTITDFLFAYRFDHLPWYQAGRPSAGNGALMRIAPVLLPHLRRMSDSVWRDVIAATVLTHRDEAAVAASVGFVGLLCECLGWRASAAPDQEWWLRTFLHYAGAVETPGRQGEAAGSPAVYAPRVPGDRFRGTLCDRTEQVLRRAFDAGSDALEAGECWYSGAYLLETVPCTLLLLARHGHDPEEAIVRAVNDTRDNDTIAAIVGAAVGALHGVHSLPSRWRDALLGRTLEHDDGRVQELVEAAVDAFVR